MCERAASLRPVVAVRAIRVLGAIAVLSTLLCQVVIDGTASERPKNSVMASDVANDGAGNRAFEAPLGAGSSRKNKTCGEQTGNQ